MKLPNTWRFRQHTAPDGTWKWAFYATALCTMISAYDLRREAVKLARAFRTEGLELPGWLQELVR